MFEFYICSSLLKNTTFNFGSSKDKLAISKIPLSSNEKLSPPISHNLVSSSLYFEGFLKRIQRLLWTKTRIYALLGIILFLFRECMKE